MFVPDRVTDLTFRYSDDSSQLSRGQRCLGLFLEEDPLYLQEVEEGGALQADRLPGHVAPHLGVLRSEVLLCITIITINTITILTNIPSMTLVRFSTLSGC